jgi:hypothetical protein
MALKKIMYYLFVSIILIDACKPSVEPVNSEFQKYYEEFVQIAKAKGVVLPDIKINIQFTDDENYRTGVCMGNGRILINRASWEIQQYNESFKKHLIFHELGHCALARDHDSEVLSNHEFKTIMRGTPLYENSFLNLRGKRWQYYIDELFDPNTPEPAWAQVANFNDPINNSQRKLLYSLSFNAVKLTDIVSTDTKNMTVLSDGLEIKTEPTSVSNFTTEAILTQITNFQNIVNYEAEIKIQINNGLGGLRWYFTEDQDPNVFARNGFPISIQPNQISIGGHNFSYYKLMANVGLQTIKIRKIKSDVFFFLNNQLIAQSDILDTNLPTIDFFGKSLKWHFVFFVGQNANVKLTDFKFYEITL